MKNPECQVEHAAGEQAKKGITGSEKKNAGKERLNRRQKVFIFSWRWCWLEIRKAVREDNDALVNLLARCPQGTNLVVRLNRSPDFFARSQPYEKSQTFVAEEDGKIIGSGECALKNVRLGGERKRAGYLYSFATDAEYRGRGIARRLEEACSEYVRSEGAQFCYCWILEDNVPSLKAFGKQGYEEEALLKAYAILPFKKKPVFDGVRALKEQDKEEVTDLLNETYRDYDYYNPYTPTTFQAFLESLPGFSLDDFVVYEKSGRIVSCLGCWDYSRAIQGTIIKLSTQLRLVSMVFRFLRFFKAMPRVPELGKDWAYCVPELPGYRHSPDDLIPLWNWFNNFAVERKSNVILFPLDPKSNLVKLAKQDMHVSVGIHQLVKPLEDFTFSSSRLIYGDPIDI